MLECTIDLMTESNLTVYMEKCYFFGSIFSKQATKVKHVIEHISRLALDTTHRKVLEIIFVHTVDI